MAPPRKRNSAQSVAVAFPPSQPKNARTEDILTAPSADVDQPDADEKSLRFLDLPPELRIVVYEMILRDHPAKLHRNSSFRRLASASSLVRVNRQLHDEFLDFTSTAASIIETTVINFGFGHIVTFLNGLSESELQKLSTPHGDASTAPAPRVICIRLQMSDIAHITELRRWLNRANHQTKKGANIKFQYQCDPASPRNYLPDWMWFHPTLSRVLRSYEQGSRRMEESRKIEQALEDAHRMYNKARGSNSPPSVGRTWPWAIF